MCVRIRRQLVTLLHLTRLQWKLRHVLGIVRRRDVSGDALIDIDVRLLLDLVCAKKVQALNSNFSSLAPWGIFSCFHPSCASPLNDMYVTETMAVP